MVFPREFKLYNNAALPYHYPFDEKIYQPHADDNRDSGRITVQQDQRRTGKLSIPPQRLHNLNRQRIDLLTYTKCGIIETERRRGQPIDYERGAFVIYKVGDHLAHPGHGGCTIQELCKREYGGQVSLYFVLMPASDSSITILAPVENAEKIGLREIITIEEADQILIFLSEAKVEWISDNKKRSQAYETTLRSGDLHSLARMIKELLLQESMAILSNSDKEILPKAQRLLFSEIALAKGINFERTLCLVNHAIMA